MESATMLYLPVGLWLLAAALTILILLVVFGYHWAYRKRVEATLGPGLKDIGSLEAAKEQLQADVKELRAWIANQKDELLKLEAERQEQEEIRVELARLQQECATKDSENQSLRNEVGELENQKHLISQVHEKLSREVAELESKRKELQSIADELSNGWDEKEKLQGELDKLRKEREAIISGMAEGEVRVQVLINEKIALQGKLEDLENKLEQTAKELKQNILSLQQVNEKLGPAETRMKDLQVNEDKLRSAFSILENRHKTLTEQLKKLEEDLATMSRKKSELVAKFIRDETKANEIREKADKAEVEAEEASRDLSNVQKDRQRLDIEMNELNARKAAIEQELVKLKGSLDTRPGVDEDPLAAYTDLLKEPACLSENAFVEKREVQNEIILLQNLKTDLRREGLIFTSRVIAAFHTSLKCHDINPITVLAGVSGTGKTLLPMRYAEIMGMHRLVMAVQPRWDSPQDMFGFYNYLEKEYKATELSRSLVRMDKYNFKGEDYPMLDSDWTKDRMLLILLDEMDLARTEYSFSEFLSKLELRREISNPSDDYNRSQAEIELDAGPGKQLRLWVGHNVFFVGTLNEDETTQTLSDKVLDRANVIRFGRPDEKAKAARHNARAQAVSRQYLSLSQWDSWKCELDEGAGWYEQVVGWTQRLNAALDRVGRPFGFRVQQAIGQYVANYPFVDDGDSYKFAFADQVEQKIIPKLRGVDLGDANSNECLSELETVIDELGDNELGDSFAAARTESGKLGMFQWRGVRRRMEEDDN